MRRSALKSLHVENSIHQLFGTSSDEVVLMESIAQSANYLLVERINTSEGQNIEIHTQHTARI